MNRTVAENEMMEEEPKTGITDQKERGAAEKGSRIIKLIVCHMLRENIVRLFRVNCF